MLKNKQITKITDLINEEMQRAVDMHGDFNSEHEAYSVIKEEFEEILEEIDVLSEIPNAMWKIIRMKEPLGGYTSQKTITMVGYRHCVALITEAIQLAAMFKKLDEGIKKKV
jgi:hypothetical protein